MSNNEVWYYGSVYTREPSEAVVVKRTRSFVTLKDGERARIDGEFIVYRPSKAKWFEWLHSTLKANVDCCRYALERAESNFKEAQELLYRELDLEMKGTK